MLRKQKSESVPMRAVGEPPCQVATFESKEESPTSPLEDDRDVGAVLHLLRQRAGSKVGSAKRQSKVARVHASKKTGFAFPFARHARINDGKANPER